MPRSTYIYVVTQNSELTAAFTVKHELGTWLGRRWIKGAYQVWRLPDSPIGLKPVVEITDELEEAILEGI